MTEKTIEEYLRKQVKALGGKAYKFGSPGNAGVPDRLVVLPKGLHAFVELKAPGKLPSPLQKMQIKKLDTLGHTVLVLDSLDAVDGFIKACKGLLGKGVIIS